MSDRVISPAGRLWLDDTAFPREPERDGMGQCRSEGHPPPPLCLQTDAPPPNQLGPLNTHTQTLYVPFLDVVSSLSLLSLTLQGFQLARSSTSSPRRRRPPGDCCVGLSPLSFPFTGME